MKECPCGYGLLYKAVVKQTGDRIVICAECDNMWMEHEEITEDNVRCLDTYAEENGIKPWWSELVLLNDRSLIYKRQWEGSRLEKMIIDTENVLIAILTCDEIIEIRAENYIGVLHEGYCGKPFIKTIDVKIGKEFTQNILRKMKRNHVTNIHDEVHRNPNNTWYEIMIEFADSSKIIISCSDVYIVNPEYNQIYKNC